MDQGESPHQAATRELAEEVGGAVSVEPADHVISNHSPKTGLCLHFYAKEISMATLRELEGGATRVHDWGAEVFGILRCPLYTLPNGLGFPAFLSNQFIGNSRDQLLTAIRKRGLLTEEEIRLVLEKANSNVNCVVSKDDIDY